MNNKIKIIGICGSLRKASFNRKTLNTAKQNLPPNVDFEIVEIGDLPHFNEDLEGNPPNSVIVFREKIKSADGILFAVPEYNYSVPSVLKNVIEWASRPYENGVIKGKPVAMMGTSIGMLGTARAQYHLRQILVQTDCPVLNRPEVMITFAPEKFNAQGILTDAKTLEKIKELVDKFAGWIGKLKKMELV